MTHLLANTTLSEEHEVIASEAFLAKVWTTVIRENMLDSTCQTLERSTKCGFGKRRRLVSRNVVPDEDIGRPKQTKTTKERFLLGLKLPVFNGRVPNLWKTGIYIWCFRHRIRVFSLVGVRLLGRARHRWFGLHNFLGGKRCAERRCCDEIPATGQGGRHSSTIQSRRTAAV